MTWQRSLGAGAKPRNSTGSSATPCHGQAPALPPGVLSGGTNLPGMKRLVGTGGGLLLLFIVALKFTIMEDKQ